MVFLNAQLVVGNQQVNSAKPSEACNTMAAACKCT